MNAAEHPWRPMKKDSMPAPGVLFLARRYLYQEDPGDREPHERLFFLAEITVGKDGFGDRVVSGFRIHSVEPCVSITSDGPTIDDSPGQETWPLTMIDAWMPIPGVSTSEDSSATDMSPHAAGREDD